MRRVPESVLTSAQRIKTHFIVTPIVISKIYLLVHLFCGTATAQGSHFFYDRTGPRCACTRHPESASRSGYIHHRACACVRACKRAIARSKSLRFTPAHTGIHTYMLSSRNVCTFGGVRVVARQRYRCKLLLWLVCIHGSEWCVCLCARSSNYSIFENVFI